MEMHAEEGSVEQGAGRKIIYLWRGQQTRYFGFSNLSERTMEK